MTDDIVARLRAWAECEPNNLLEAASADLFVAAAEIERLRAALERIELLHYDSANDFYHDATKAHDIARAALAGETLDDAAP